MPKNGDQRRIIAERCSSELIAAVIGRVASPQHHQYPQSQPLSGWDFFLPVPQCWRGFRAWPRERRPCGGGVFAPAADSLCSAFSGGHATSVREATSFAGAGLEEVGCGCNSCSGGDSV